MSEREGLVPVNEAAETLGVGRRTLYRLIGLGTLPAYKFVLDRRTYVSLEEAKAALAALPPARRRPRRWRPDPSPVQGGGYFGSAPFSPNIGRRTAANCPRASDGTEAG